MKRAVFLLSSVPVLLGMLSAQGITFTSPKGGENWKLGSPVTISWDFQGYASGIPVSIKLFQGATIQGKLVGTWSIGAGGHGTWAWAKAGQYIGGTAGAGSGYTIRIQPKDGSGPEAVSNSFTLGSGGTEFTAISINLTSDFQVVGGSIPVSEPVQGLQRHAGQALYIKWNQAPIAGYAKVKIEVYAPDRKTYIGSIHIPDLGPRPNTGAYDDALILPARYEVGKDYVIRVATPDEKYAGFSGAFHIVPLEKADVTETITPEYAYFLPFGATAGGGLVPSMNELGSAPAPKPSTCPNCLAVGWDGAYSGSKPLNWSYSGHVYRAMIKFPRNGDHGYNKANLLKAELRIPFNQGKLQTLFLLKRLSDSNALNAPVAPLATINGNFGAPAVVDVTKTIKGWIGPDTDFGFVIKGGNESFPQENVDMILWISPPTLVVSWTNYY